MRLISRIKENIKDFKEADAFVKSEYETEEEQKDDRIVRVTLVVLGIVLIALFGVIIFAIKAPLTTIYKTYSNLEDKDGYYPNGKVDQNGNNEKSDNPYINGTVENQEYKKYKIGDTITLKDNSKWYVIQDSKEDDSFVVLLGTQNINDGTINYQNAEDYLENKYKVAFAKGMKADPDVITARLISLNDISIVSGINEEQLDVNSEIQNDKTPKFIYESINLTNHLDDNNNPVLICPNNGKAILCTGNPPLDPWIIKPVVELPKEYIK